MAEDSRTRVLLMAEAVTLAHVSRMVVLGETLDPQRYSIGLACDPRYQALYPDFRGQTQSLLTISSQRFLESLAAGKPLYAVDTLRDYVRADLAAIEEFRPHVVVGDFRLSLSVSARVAGVPYINVINAYWSPFSRMRYWVPEIPLARLLGYRVGQAVFTVARPVAFAVHARPLNQVRREYGLSHLGYDLRAVYSDADYTAYPDIPDLIPTPQRPPHHSYLGPVLWSPPSDLPEWWEQLPDRRQVVFVSLGSSGEASLLPDLLAALADLPVVVLAATANRVRVETCPANARVAPFLPGVEAARRSGLIICNGGSPSTYQALAAGIPVLGIPSNLDQCLNLSAVCDAGAGVSLRLRDVRPARLRELVERLLGEDRYRQAAERLAVASQAVKPEVAFPALVARATATAGVAQH